jgi:hypothetical protein
MCQPRPARAAGCKTQGQVGNGHLYTPGSIGSNSLLEPVDPGVYRCTLQTCCRTAAGEGILFSLVWPGQTTVHSI